jgi:hypothetical protein
MFCSVHSFFVWCFFPQNTNRLCTRQHQRIGAPRLFQSRCVQVAWILSRCLVSVLLSASAKVCTKTILRQFGRYFWTAARLAWTRRRPGSSGVVWRRRVRTATVWRTVFRSRACPSLRVSAGGLCPSRAHAAAITILLRPPAVPRRRRRWRVGRPYAAAGRRSSRGAGSCRCSPSARCRPAAARSVTPSQHGGACHVRRRYRVWRAGGAQRARGFCVCVAFAGR